VFGKPCKHCAGLLNTKKTVVPLLPSSYTNLLWLLLQQGIIHMLALPIVKMLYIYILCPHSEHQKNPFQSN
jgi:hypothetical protein